MRKLGKSDGLLKGYLASISRTGRLWFSKLCEIEYYGDRDFAEVIYNKELDRIEIFPFKKGGWTDDPNVWALRSVEDNGVVLNIFWVRKLAEERDLCGQYIPYYNKEKNMIFINLKERVKRYPNSGGQRKWLVNCSI